MRVDALNDTEPGVDMVLEIVLAFLHYRRK
jgi:hypothetical protein